MPHLVILYTANLDRETDMSALCRTMADTMLAQRDETGKQVFPTGGVRVLAYPAAHSAVADGKGEACFANAPFPQQRDETMVGCQQAGAQFSDFGLTADEGC